MIVSYEQKYEKEVIELWNQELVHDGITVEKFRVQALLDDNFDSNLCLVYIIDKKVVGFILATKRKFPYLDRGLEPNRGWINVMFVDEQYSRKGIGQSLLNEVEDRLIKEGVTEITLAAYSPNYFLSGIDTINYKAATKFFEKNSYVAGEEAYSMSRDLHGFQMSEKMQAKKKVAEEEGYRFVRYEPKYLLSLLEFARVEFGGGWKRNLLIAMQQKRAEDTVLIIVDEKDQPVAFCMRQIDGNPLRFGPIGVSSKVRNLGLGGILLEWQLEEMANKGYYHMFFLSTDIPGRRFYERHGLKVFRTFTDYRKELVD